MRAGSSVLKLGDVPTLRVYWLGKTAKEMSSTQRKLQIMLCQAGLAEGPRNVTAFIQSSLRHAVARLTMILPGDEQCEEERLIWPLGQQQQQPMDVDRGCCSIDEKSDQAVRELAISQAQSSMAGGEVEEMLEGTSRPKAAKATATTRLDACQEGQQVGEQAQVQSLAARSEGQPLQQGTTCPERVREQGTGVQAGEKWGKQQLEEEGHLCPSDEEDWPDVTEEDEQVITDSASTNPVLQAALAKTFAVNLERYSVFCKIKSKLEQQLQSKTKAHQIAVQSLQTEKEDLASRIAHLQKEAVEHESSLSKIRLDVQTEKLEMELQLTSIQARHESAIRELREELGRSNSHADAIWNELQSSKAQAQVLASKHVASQDKNKQLEEALKNAESCMSMLYGKLLAWEKFRAQAVKLQEWSQQQLLNRQRSTPDPVGTSPSQAHASASEPLTLLPFSLPAPVHLAAAPTQPRPSLNPGQLCQPQHDSESPILLPLWASKAPRSVLVPKKAKQQPCLDQPEDPKGMASSLTAIVERQQQQQQQQQQQKWQMERKQMDQQEQQQQELHEQQRRARHLKYQELCSSLNIQRDEQPPGKQELDTELWPKHQLSGAHIFAAQGTGDEGAGNLTAQQTQPHAAGLQDLAPQPQQLNYAPGMQQQQQQEQEQQPTHFSSGTSPFQTGVPAFPLSSPPRTHDDLAVERQKLLQERQALQLQLEQQLDIKACYRLEISNTMR